MKFALCLVLAFGVFAVSKAAAVKKQEKRAIDPATAMMIINVALPVVNKVVSAIGEMFFKPLFANQFDRNYIDDMIMGRAVRIYKVDETTVTILDRASGVKTTGTGANGQEAIENATKMMLVTLLKTGKMSLLDLGIQEVRTTTQAPCVDRHGYSYCHNLSERGFCAVGHTMSDFMRTYCFKSCGGC